MSRFFINISSETPQSEWEKKAMLDIEKKHSEDINKLFLEVGGDYLLVFSLGTLIVVSSFDKWSRSFDDFRERSWILNELDALLLEYDSFISGINESECSFRIYKMNTLNNMMLFYGGDSSRRRFIEALYLSRNNFLIKNDLIIYEKIYDLFSEENNEFKFENPSAQEEFLNIVIYLRENLLVDNKVFLSSMMFPFSNLKELLVSYFNTRKEYRLISENLTKKEERGKEKEKRKKKDIRKEIRQKIKEKEERERKEKAELIFSIFIILSFIAWIYFMDSFLIGIGCTYIFIIMIAMIKEFME